MSKRPGGEASAINQESVQASFVSRKVDNTVVDSMSGAWLEAQLGELSLPNHILPRKKEK